MEQDQAVDQKTRWSKIRSCNLWDHWPGDIKITTYSYKTKDTGKCVQWEYSNQFVKSRFHLSGSISWERSTVMIADSSQTRILAKVNGPFLHARWWLWNLILDVHTLLHFGQMKVLAEDNRDATTSFCLLGLSCAASCLSASNFRLAVFTDERPLSSCYHNWWLIPACVQLYQRFLCYVWNNITHVNLNIALYASPTARK